MERAAFRFGVVGVGVASALVSVLFLAAAAAELERPKRVGVHLEFPADDGADEALMAGVRRSLPRLLESTQAEDIQVKDVDAATLEVSFVPPAAWSEIHGLQAEGEERAAELVPDGLRTLLTTSRDLRVLELAEERGADEVERDRAARLLDHHPERALDVLRGALHEAQLVRSIAWLPRESGSGPLVPVIVEGSDERRITILDLVSASRGRAGPEVVLSFDGLRRAKLEPYLQEIAGRRMAFVVDGAIEGIGKAGAYRFHRLSIVGEAENELTPETCASIVAHVREPLSPRAPRLTRSWISPEKSITDVVFELVIAAASAILAVAMASVFVRDVRRPPVVKKEADWSSAA
jgi:hypothetical protein